MKTLTVRNVIVGRGMPKICISLTGRNIPELIEDTRLALESKPDIFELRADSLEYADDPDCIIESLKQIRFLIKDNPLIFTFRSESEGGNKSVSNQEYIRIIEAAARSGEADFIDIELNKGYDVISGLTAYIRRSGALVLMSAHDLTGTPDEDTIISILMKMQELDADIPKLAVMARSEEDLLILLKATLSMSRRYADRPFITAAMGEIGIISRICGGIFGSSVTFARGRKASAPGQLSVQELKRTLKLLHKPSECDSE